MSILSPYAYPLVVFLLFTLMLGSAWALLEIITSDLVSEDFEDEVEANRKEQAQ